MAWLAAVSVRPTPPARREDHHVESRGVGLESIDMGLSSNCEEGRLYARRSPVDNVYEVLASTKHEQAKDISWLRRQDSRLK